MPYPTRTLAQLATEAWAGFTQAIPGATVSTWPNTFKVVGKVLALLGFENEQRRAWLARQQFASTADREWLVRHGWELGLVPDPATAAVGTATVSCTPGLAIPQGLQFTRADGATFSVRTATTPSGSSTSLPLAADTAGATGNTDATTSLALVPSTGAPAGLGTTATVDSAGLTGGADAEATEAFRARVLYRKRNPPQGGAAVDYVEWTDAALATVTGVWVDSFVGNPGHVWVCFTVSDQPDGIPSVGQVAIVQAYLDDPIRRPVTARVNAGAPTAVTVDITVAGLFPDTPDTRAAVSAEMAAVFDEHAAPATPNTASVLYRTWLDGALSRAIGVQHATMTLPAADLTYSTAGDLPVLGTITFV
jgi:uncharacterized phage protein gp47/JayE